MGIQISEDKLSPRAQAALRNAKSKSQFLRDAIEFYVSRDMDSMNTLLSELMEEIKALRKMLSSSQQIIAAYNESAASSNADSGSVKAILKYENCTRVQGISNIPSDSALSQKEKEAERLLDESIINILEL